MCRNRQQQRCEQVEGIRPPLLGLAASQRRAPIRPPLNSKHALNLPRPAAATARPWMMGARQQRWRRQQCPLQAGAATFQLQGRKWAGSRGESAETNRQGVHHARSGSSCGVSQQGQGSKHHSCWPHRTARPAPQGRRAAPAPQSAEGSSSSSRDSKAESKGRH